MVKMCTLDHIGVTRCDKTAENSFFVTLDCWTLGLRVLCCFEQLLGWGWRIWLGKTQGRGKLEGGICQILTVNCFFDLLSLLVLWLPERPGSMDPGRDLATEGPRPTLPTFFFLRAFWRVLGGDFFTLRWRRLWCKSHKHTVGSQM